MNFLELKRLAGERAAEYVKNETIVGLGTGSTVYYTIHRLGQLVKGGLKIECIPTSRQTEELTRKLGLPLTDFSRVDQLDLTIDGADEVDPYCNLIKGRWGALLQEKIIASVSKELIIVVDETKLKRELGSAPLPVEVAPFGWQATAKRLAQLGCEPFLREVEGEPYLTDNHNFILDCRFGLIRQPDELEIAINNLVGVVENGLFVKLADRVVVGRREGDATYTVEEIHCKR